MNVVSFKTVLAEAIRKYPIIKDIVSEEDAMSALTSMLKINHVPNVTLERGIAFVEVEGSRAKIPANVYDIYTVGKSNKKTLEEAICNPDDVIPMVGNFDWMSRNMKGNPTYRGYNAQSPFSYFANKGYIFPNFEKGIIVISYSTLMLADDGTPLFPDNEQWIQAGAAEIAYECATRLFYSSSIPATVFQHIENRRNQLLKAAVSNSKIPSRDRRAGFKRYWTNNIPNQYPEENFYSGLNEGNYSGPGK